MPRAGTKESVRSWRARVAFELSDAYENNAGKTTGLPSLSQRYVKMCGIAADPSDYDLLVSDVGEVSDWALDAVKWGCENNIYVLDGGLLKARQPSSRANVAMLLLNLVDMLAD